MEPNVYRSSLSVSEFWELEMYQHHYRCIQIVLNLEKRPTLTVRRALKN